MSWGELMTQIELCLLIVKYCPIQTYYWVEKIKQSKTKQVAKQYMWRNCLLKAQNVYICV